MDSIVHAALEEICAEGINGLTLPNLWPKLQSSISSNGLHLCTNVKKAIWTNLLNIPGLQFKSKGANYNAQDCSIQSVEKCEEMNLTIVAAENLRNSFIGIYDIKASDAGIPQPQRRALERLAIARTNGITQSELAKEFGMKGNNIFYVLRKLECRGLIARQSTVLRKKEICNEGEAKNSSIVTTNMLHLYRYARHLGCQQRMEITKEDKILIGNEDVDAAIGAGVAEECVKEDVVIKDFLPALKAICDKLEKADGKVLVVSDIKQELGYRGTSGHRAWRNICNRLKDACVVEEFLAKVNKKEVSCLRLLKKFSPKNFEPKSHGCRSDDLDIEQPVKLGKRGQINDQLVDLPIEHQIYDMIDAEGSKGLKITEVYERLGINNKKYYDRLLTMFSRFGMHLQAESHNKGAAYRVWTSGNFPSEASISKPENPSNENSVGNSHAGNLHFQKKSTEMVQGVDCLTPERCGRGATAEHDSVVVDSAISHASPTDNESNDMLLCQSSSQNLPPHEPISIIVPDTDLQIVEKPTESSPDLSAKSTPKRRRRSYPRYPCLALSAVSTQREQRIVDLLKEEKFIIKADLHRQIENLDKDKHTSMDRKTLDRSLNKLQQEGHCKVIRVSVPVVSNCRQSRASDVVLHPSYKDVSPGLLGQIHDRMRAFDMETRGQGYSRPRKHQSLPVLDGVERTSNITRQSQAERSEAMRANGYVLAKMVRLKLLHIFLWGYLNGLPGWDDALLSGKHGYDHKNPHSTCKSFELDAAIKSIPLELFLQVVGSTKKFEDLVEKCRVGLRLSDLPVAEYKLLMDAQATGRVSYLIDILRRLKLMRTVSVEHLEGAAEVRHTTLTYALELKPYIEEPVTMVEPSSGFTSFDFRPQIRHDFVLSSREAVDEYWNTLEYCYAAADSKAALHAFPGSAVHEVFLFRSWVSVRVMTAEQRAQLLERIVNEDSNKKLSFKECETIAKDLNLTLEQVLRVYYDKRQKRISKGVEDYHILKKKSSRKRKRSSRRKSLNHVKAGTSDGESSEQRHDKLSDADDQLTEEQSSLSSSMHNDHMEAIEEEPGSNGEDDEDGDTFIRKVVPKLNPSRGKKFSWTEEADRQLVIQYARHRAALGAKFHRVDWSSVKNLPGPPKSCKRRMAVLNSSSSIQFRKAMMRLCNLLSERYSKYLDKFQNKSLRKGDSNALIRNCSPKEYCSMNVSNSLQQNTEELDHEATWDDFNNKKIKTALDEVLLYKRMAKLDPSHGVGSVYDEYSNLNIDVEGHDPQGSKVVSSTPSSLGSVKVSGKKLSCHRIPRKYIKLLNEGMSVSRRAYESLAVSNAAELFKLVFLSTSTAPEVPNLLAETLRRYSEHDLFAAFHYLREKKIMIGGNGSSPFVLSQQFLQRISSSPFPSNTGKRAAKFANWLREREKDMIEEGIDLTADLQCGDIIHLFAKVTSGELLIQPFLPDHGVGEAEDLRTSKRKSDDNEEGNKSKKSKPSPSAGEGGEIISRREKGFPGIRISLSCALISKADVGEFGKSMDPHSDALPFSRSDQVSSSTLVSVSSDSPPFDPMKELLACGYTVPSNVDATESPWEAMAQYAKHIATFPINNQEQGCPLCPELFRTVHSAIQKAGDQGLSIEEISEVMNIHGEKMPELIIEVLEAFGRALKVNGYASVRVVDYLYRSKYFLTPVAGLHQDHKVDPLLNPERRIISDDHLIPQRENLEDDGSNLQMEMSMSPDEMHRVTILNLPPEEVAAQPTNEIQSINEIESSMQARVISPERDQRGNTNEVRFCDSNLPRPILPWINGDGTINVLVYRGLVRRVLGIVMQNPGILEDDIVSQMRVLNPQSCRSLLELMILDNHIFVRKMNQTTPGEPPGILGRLIGNSFNKSKMISREHFFANPMCTSIL